MAKYWEHLKYHEDTVVKEMNKYIKWGWKVEKIEVNPYQYLNKTHYVTIYLKWDEE